VTNGSALDVIVPSDFEVRIWAESSGAEDTQFAYWNDEEIESAKAWNVAEGKGLANQERHVQQSGLLDLLRLAVRTACDGGAGLGRAGADLACGTAWAVPHLLEDSGIERIFCVEYSRHRLLKLAPVVLRHYDIPRDRVVLCLGSFYDLRIDSGALDFVLLAEALHHAGDPLRLLAEVRRVLSRDGVVIVIGEHIVPSLPRLYGAHAARWLVSRTVPAAIQRKLRGKTINRPRALWCGVRELLAPNPITGDHYYRDSDYERLFREANFRSTPVRIPGIPMQGFVLRPEAVP